jgi:hypothetical protein
MAPLASQPVHDPYVPEAAGIRQKRTVSKAIVGEALASSFLDSSLRMLEQWFAIVIALLLRSVPLCRAGFFWHRPKRNQKV